MIYRWLRVNRKRRCEVCNKPDWCTYAPEVGLALCMRTESDRPSKNVLGGWLHRVSEPCAYVQKIEVQAEAPVDFQRMWKRWIDKTDHYHLDGFAMSLGVDTDSLRSLGCAWSGSAWAFPMRNAENKVIGIRLRSETGKWAVKGSKQGLFIPDVRTQRTLYILEGPTDTAAALSLGLFAIGRPSCMGCEDMILDFVRLRSISRVVLITDNDTPGLRGAYSLQNRLPVLNCVYSPPCKDLREFVRRGGDRLVLESSIKDLVWSERWAA